MIFTGPTLEGSMQCPRCLHENRPGAKFCDECGTPVAATARATPYADLKNENEGLARSLSEAIEQQTATSEILKVISSSPTDAQPVFDAVAQTAARLCDSSDADIWRRVDDRLRLVAHYGAIPVGPVAEFGLPLVHGTVGGRSILTGQLTQVGDVQAAAAEFPQSAENARRVGFRTILSVPLIREGVAIGVIILRRTEARLFTEQQVALLQTFADQAVIAIENVRLFTELEHRNRALTEALEQQTATADILRIISASPTDLQPVLDTVVRNAAHLCGAYDAAIWEVEGTDVQVAAHFGPIPAPVGHGHPIGRGFVAGRTILDRRPVHVADLQAEEAEYPTGSASAKEGGFRTILSVPLLREGTAVGALLLRRTEVKPFTDGQLSLLQTFAAQAVIAIENVRLFNETKEALEQQTATAEILKVISSSPTDVQPVFDAIVESATRLCAGTGCALFTTDGERIYLRAAPLPIRRP